MAGVDAPQNFNVHVVGRSITFSWDEVAGADHYVIVTTGDGKSWDDYEVYDTEVTLDNMNNLYNWTEYKFCARAVNDAGLKGPKSETKKIYMAYAFDNYDSLVYDTTYSYKKSTDNSVTITWENIKTSSHTGCPGIQYKVYRRAGDYSKVSGYFQSVEGEERVLIADHIKPSKDNADVTMSYSDSISNLEEGRAYEYTVLPYSEECNWESDRFIEVKVSGYHAKCAYIAPEED